MWDLMCSYMAHLKSYPFHLHVTLVKDNRELKDKILAFHRESTIHIVENRGYDVGPFLYFLHRINLAEYDYIIKLHTKRGVPKEIILVGGRYLGKEFWRTLMLRAILGSRKRVMANVNLFEKHPEVGMIGSKNTMMDAALDADYMRDYLKETLHRLGYAHTAYRTFFAGTMFMARSSVLQIIKDNFTFMDFEFSEKTRHDGTLAHAMERLLGIFTQEQGYRLQGVGIYPYYEIVALWMKIYIFSCRLWHRSRGFFFRKKLTKNNRLIIKVCKIPVWCSVRERERT